MKNTSRNDFKDGNISSGDCSVTSNFRTGSIKKTLNMQISQAATVKTLEFSKAKKWKWIS